MSASILHLGLDVSDVLASAACNTIGLHSLKQAARATRAATSQFKKLRDSAHIVATLIAGLDLRLFYEHGFMNELAMAAAGLRSDPTNPAYYLPALLLIGRPNK